jgi:hypothetical protein
MHQELLRQKWRLAQRSMEEERDPKRRAVLATQTQRRESDSDN